MKKLIGYFLAIVAVIGLLVMTQTWIAGEEQANKPTTADASTRKPLYLFNWGNYVDPDLIAKFEAETGYQVIYETFDSNDAMEVKLKQGGTPYDLVFPSESSVPKLLEQNLLLPLDHSQIHGMENISSFLLDNAFDKGNRYTVPYFWGTIGMMVNTQQVDVDQIQTWKDLWKPEFKQSILLVDGNRETMGMALQALGYSQNSKNRQELAAAESYLGELTPNVRAVLVEEIKTLMIAGESPIGIGYSGDAATVIAENPDIQYVLPKDGGAVWTDNFAIPYTSQNPEGAYAFINFMLQPENAAQNALYVAYATPNEAAKALLPEEVIQDPMLYPDPEQLAAAEHYDYLGKEWLEIYHDKFLTFKMGL